jgi:hypothetical protein
LGKPVEKYDEARKRFEKHRDERGVKRLEQSKAAGKGNRSNASKEAKRLKTNLDRNTSRFLFLLF